jgi:hypothetical protein
MFERYSQHKAEIKDIDEDNLTEVFHLFTYHNNKIILYNDIKRIKFHIEYP